MSALTFKVYNRDVLLQALLDCDESDLDDLEARITYFSLKFKLNKKIVEIFDDNHKFSNLSELIAQVIRDKIKRTNSVEEIDENEKQDDEEADVFESLISYSDVLVELYNIVLIQLQTIYELKEKSIELNLIYNESEDKYIFEIKNMDELEPELGLQQLAEIVAILNLNLDPIEE